jgi:hypothetical protein
VVTVWGVVIVAALLLVAVGVWLLLRRANPHGQHRGSGRARRRDPHDPVIRDDEPPPNQL